MSDTRTQHSLVIAVLLYFIMVVMAAFNEVPVSQEVPVGSEAVFRCRHSAADIIRWRVNETLIGRNPPPDITPSTTRDEEDNLVDTLTVVARLEYSGTVVVCVAQFDDGTRLSSEPPASLLVQGTFIEDPVSQTVFVGDTAMFRCRHSMTNVIDWILNGTMVIDATTSMPGIVPGMMSESGSMVNTLNITAQRKHNATEIVARARLRGDSSEDSRPAMLQVIVPFVEDPQSLNVTVGEEAVFRCRHPNTLAIGWTVNGTIFSDLQNLDFRLGIVDHVHSLTITAHARYNSSEIQCVATFLNDRSNIPSPSAVLQIQGPLDAVASLTKVNTTISWSAPFSLNLTGIEPDIVYCVDVYNITCGGRDLVSSDYFVTDTNYTCSLCDGYLCEYIVTPRSNVEGAENGTESYLRDTVPTFHINSSQLSLGGQPNKTNYHIVLNHSSDQPLPSSFTLSLKASDDIDELDRIEIPGRTKKEPNLVELSVTDLEYRRLWDCTIFVLGCDEYTILKDAILSTHDFYHISISSPSAGVVRVTGRFVEGSPSTGVLVIVSGDSGATYHISSRNGSGSHTVTISGLAGGEYTVSVFVVEENGLPFERAAIIPEHLSVQEDTAEAPPPTIEYSLKSTSTCVHVECNFLATDASECIAVVHDRNLTNIESSHKFTRSGDTASGCIKGVNLEDYQVGVIGGRQLNLLLVASSSGVCDIECVLGSVLVMTFLVASISVVFMIAHVCISPKYRRKKFGRRSRANSVNNEKSGLPGHSNANHYEPINQQNEIKLENTPLVTLVLASRVQADSSGSGGLQLQPSFTTPPVTPHRASDDIGQTGAVPESAYAEPALLVKPSVSIPPVTERSTYSSVEKFQNPQGLTYALLEHVSQKQHNPRPDDRYTTKSEYSEVVIKKECSKTKEGEENKEKFAPNSVPPPSPCDIESVGKLLQPISYKWEKFALALSLDDDHIDDVNTANETDEACLQDVVKRYFDNEYFNHNWEEIVTILRGVDEQLADKIHDLHVYPYETALPGQVKDTKDSNTPVQSGIPIKHKQEVIDFLQREDGDGTALSGNDEDFDDTEQKQPPEGDVVAHVHESVSVSTKPDHQISKESKSSKSKCLRRQDSENSDSELFSDIIDTESGEQPSYVCNGDNVHLAGEGGSFGHPSIQSSDQQDCDELKYVTIDTRSYLADRYPDHDDGKRQHPIAVDRVASSLTCVVTDDLANCVLFFSKSTSCVPYAICSEGKSGHGDPVANNSEVKSGFVTPKQVHTLVDNEFYDGGCHEASYQSTRSFEDYVPTPNVHGYFVQATPKRVNSFAVEQETCSATGVDISQHNYAEKLQQEQASKLQVEMKLENIARKTYDEICGVTRLSCDDTIVTSSQETILDKRLWMAVADKGDKHLQ